MVKVQIAKDLIKRKIIDLLRKIGRLKTPMDMVIMTLKIKELLPDPLIALDLFGMHGLWVTADYAPLCRHLDFWEINRQYAKFAQKYFSHIDFQAHVGDSIDAVKTGNSSLRKDYNFIVIDCPFWSPFGAMYYEHFDLFPFIFDYIAMEGGVLVFTVLFNLKLHYNKQEFSRTWIERRKEFYGLNEDGQAINLDIVTLMTAYKNRVPHHLFDLVDIFLVPRSLTVGHLVIALKRKRA